MAKEKAEKTEAAKDGSAEITYVPKAGDPTMVKWNGIMFHANVPQKIPYSKTVRQLIKQEKVIDGRIDIRSVETDVPLIEMAKLNHSFSVDGVQAEHKRGIDRLPETPEQYRGYATGWIAASTDLASVHTRWKVEEGMRQACGVDANDVAYLKPFLDYKLALLGGAAPVN